MNTNNMSGAKKALLYLIGTLLIVLSGVAIGYGLYRNKVNEENIKNTNIEKKAKEDEYFIKDSKTNMEVSIGEECYNCTVSITPVNKEIKKGILRTYDIKVLDATGKEKDVEEYDITVKIPVDDELKQYKDYKMLYIVDDQIKQTWSTYTEDNIIYFETDHLGIFGITGEILPD